MSLWETVKTGKRGGSREGRKMKGRNDSFASSPLGGGSAVVMSFHHHEVNFLKRNSKELGDGSVGKVLARQA